MDRGVTILKIHPINKIITFTRRPEEMNRKYPEPTVPEPKDVFIKSKKIDG